MDLRGFSIDFWRISWWLFLTGTDSVGEPKNPPLSPDYGHELTVNCYLLVSVALRIRNDRCNGQYNIDNEK